MILIKTPLHGVCIVDTELMKDERGFFARSWCQREFHKWGLNPNLVQCNISFNHRKGTWRGMHYQDFPFEEAKLVRCTRGSICDVVVDLRRDSPTFKQHITVLLTAENRRTLYIPEGCAHGFVTLEDETEVFYQMTEFHSADSSKGFRWNDPSFGIVLPLEVTVISERDRTYPDFPL